MHLVVLGYALVPTAPARGQVAARADSMGREFFVYAPAKVERAKTYWLVVGVHGYGGNGAGAAGLADWAKRGDCVVVGPSFPNSGYQLLREEAGEQLVKLFELLRKEYKLHDRMFLRGFRAGRSSRTGS
jgi:poly(3-hydroxybutyrate) depolymerase